MVEITSVAIAVAISAVISAALYFYKEKKIEPERWKKTAKLQAVEKRLKACGELLNILRTAEERGKNWNDSSGHPHAFERPYGTEQFKRIFQENMHLFSSKLNQHYFDAIKSDTRFGLTPRKESSDPKFSSTTFTHFSLNLKEMQSTAVEEYTKIKKDFQDLTGYEFT